MVSVGIVGNLLGYPILDPIAALIVGFMVAKMGGSFGWRILVSAAPRFDGSRGERGRGGGDSQNRRGDVGRQKRARHPHPQDGRRVMQRHRALNLMTHVDPWKRSDLDHLAVLQDKQSPTG